MFKQCSKVLALLGLMLLATQANAVDYVPAKPLVDVVKTPVAACGDFPRGLQAPFIQWGPDAGFGVANGNSKRTAPGSIYAGKKLDVSIYRQDNFVQQLSDYMSCSTPFLRGTVDMVANAYELLARDPRTVPVPLTQLSWSHGGDAIVARDGIKSPRDLCGKTIAVQYGGPHMYFILKVLTDAGCKLSDVKLKWTKDLTQTDAKSISPMLALQRDPSVDAVTVIIPDANTLTSGGKVGTGSEDSVRGAHILLTSEDATTVIADVYWVRKDFFDARKNDVVMPLTNGFMQGAERLRDLSKSKGPGYKEAATFAADALLDSTDATAVKDFEDLYSGAEVVGYAGNIKFFTDPTNLRSFDKLVGEIQPALASVGFLTKVAPIAHAQWDWTALAVGLTDTKGIEAPRFSQAAVQVEVETRAKQATDDGVLFRFEVYFGPEQTTFPVDQYRPDFERATALAKTYGGALLSIEGHTNPSDYLKLKKNSPNQPMLLSTMRQSALNLSRARANALRDSLIDYAKGQGVSLDQSQFGVVGLGVSQPNTPKCKYDALGDIDLSCYPANEAEWNATRRVVLKIIRVETESSVFKPL